MANNHHLEQFLAFAPELERELLAGNVTDEEIIKETFDYKELYEASKAMVAFLGVMELTLKNFHPGHREEGKRFFCSEMNAIRKSTNNVEYQTKLEEFMSFCI